MTLFLVARRPIIGLFSQEAEILELGPLPESEMAEVRTFDALPENITYPAITPVLFQERDRIFRGQR